MSRPTAQFEVQTQGHNHVVDITGPVRDWVRDSGVSNGLVTVFVVGSTAGISTTEYEPGLASHDLAAGFERIAPAGANYQHEATWHDDNGHAHVRATILGPSLTVPIIDGELPLGTWQQIVLIDFDTRPRTRQIIVQTLSNDR